jgi:drug/metabolite transporter (DMT)-like permease
MTKGVLDSVPALTLLVIQLLCSNLLLWVVVTLQQLPIPPYAKAAKLSLPGILQPGLSFTAALSGLALTSASIEALIWSLETILIIVLAWLLLGERIRLPLLLLALLGVSGVALVTVTGEVSASSQNAPLGNLLIFIGTFCAALYTVLARRNVAYISPLLLTTLNQTMGLVSVIIIWLFSLLWIEPGFDRLTPEIWLLAALSGIMLHALPFWLHTIVLQRLPASFAALFLTLIPIFTIGGACLFLNENLSIAQWIGAACIIAAMMGVSFLYRD